MENITPRTNLNLVRQLCDLVDSMLPEPEQNPPEEFDPEEDDFEESVGTALCAEPPSQRRGEKE